LQIINNIALIKLQDFLLLLIIDETIQSM